jgi:pimeloyl-ACP methyl ester carboxylesterase/DNA-binding winged helix-turn-helix (wHTH) protein
MGGAPTPGRLALPGHYYEFDANELRTADGTRVALRPQCLEVLRCLALAAGNLVTKDELMASVWPDVVVTEDSLVQCIGALRKALGDTAQRSVQTVPRRGYRLQALAEGPRDPVGGAAGAASPPVRFATSADGVRLAYSVCGAGAPLVRAGRWMSHLEEEWDCLTEGPLLRELSRRFTLLRYDQRGQGLSDRAVAPGGPGTRARDLKAVVDAAGLARFSLFAIGTGTAIAVRFARLFPECLERLILISGFARGVAMRGERSQSAKYGDAWLRLIEDGWDDENPMVRQMSTTRHYPGADQAQMRSFNELLRRSCTTAGAIAVIRTDAAIDVSAELAQVRCPTLVVHGPANAIVPFDEGRLLAAGIPGARLRIIETPNNLPLEGEPAFDELLRMVETFVSETGPAVPASAGPIAPTPDRRAVLRILDTPGRRASR